MINLFKDSDFYNIIVKNTDGTGFGIDCPIDSTIKNCKAINCGKAANEKSEGASGFGIGFGYSEEENILIENCKAINNKKFGFFIEHQGRFNNSYYPATNSKKFIISNSVSGGNMYDFGAIDSLNVTFDNVTSISKNKYYLDLTQKKVESNPGYCGYSTIKYLANGVIILNNNKQDFYFSKNSSNIMIID